jgi:putative ABC transport system permease protein
MFWENLKMAFISLRNAKLRSFLTMLGIIIGVAAVVSILAIGQGVKNAVSSQVSSLGSNILTIMSGQASGSGNFASSLGASTITATDIESIAKVKHITGAAYMSLISGIISRGQVVDQSALIVATTPTYHTIVKQPLSAGRFFTAADASSKVVVLGDATKTALFGSASAVGQTVQLRGNSFTVIGVIAKQDSGASLGGSQDSLVFLPVGAAKAVTGTEPQIMRAFAKVDDAANVTETVTNVKGALQKNHGGQEDFSVLTQKDILATFNTIFDLLTTFIVAIAAISLLVGGIGIMNIMLVSVTERTREIGLRKAIGASSNTVLAQFLIEAIVLSLLGGALGIVVAMGIAWLAGRLASITPVLTPDAVILAVGVSAGVGIIFGIAPAIKAARKNPIQALKSI